jgi:hypothetical protein
MPLSANVFWELIDRPYLPFKTFFHLYQPPLSINQSYVMIRNDEYINV